MLRLTARNDGWGEGAGGDHYLLALRYDLYFRLQHAAGPVYLSQIGSVVAGLALAFAAFGEVPGVSSFAAAACVGLGVFLVSRRPHAGAIR